MANIRKIEGKNGTSYKITVAVGRDSTGKQKRHYMTWKPTSKMSEKQIEKAVQKAAFAFEEQIMQGFSPDNRQSFSEYAEYVISLKAKNGAKRRTIERYREMLPRINAAIGHIKLKDILPKHLNQLYDNLAEEGIRETPERATPKKDIATIMKERKLSAAALSRQTGIAASTFAPAIHGNSVSRHTAEIIAAALDFKPETLFVFQKDNRPLSAKTILEHHRLISTIMSQAEKEMLIQYNPAHRASPPKLEKREVECFQPEELQLILACLDKESIKWRTIINLLIETGCRRGEIMGLKWEDIYWEDCLLYICRSLNYTPQSGIFVDTTKTGETRYIRVSKEMIDLLRQYELWYKELKEQSGDLWQETGFVFTKDNGGLMLPDNVTQWLSTFSKKYELPPIHPHKFRHTMASLMITNRVDVVTVSKRLGHAKVSTTTDIYSHAIKEADAQAAADYAAFIRKKKTAPVPPKEEPEAVKN